MYMFVDLAVPPLDLFSPPVNFGHPSSPTARTWVGLPQVTSWVPKPQKLSLDYCLLMKDY